MKPGAVERRGVGLMGLMCSWSLSSFARDRDLSRSRFFIF
ncbi:hypothetical protein HMPREF9622_00427 [Cutibacterium modestum HL037PA3]|nr:hypothetical protein HMPREF9621_02166 [Cutibacterium modestum HL037PA2]EFT16510.1 hypothetical protein HMPREF9622_00427 [Cutibacterium modestum HL037PA3]EGG28093.1 hypothetical protein PA08_0323 [Cutibacterium modestum P08]